MIPISNSKPTSSSNNTRKFSSAQEHRVAKILGGKVVANSGATKFNKGDVLLNNILVECKTCITPKESFSIKKEWLNKNKEEAFSMGVRYSALAIDFGQGADYVVIDINLAKKLFELLEKEEKV